MTGLNIDTRIIKASFRECSIQDRILFDISSCLFLVSIGSFNHEGKRLKATINLINRSFKNCTILIGDTLYRHNFGNFKVITEEDSYLKGLELGNAWIERNLTCIESLTIPYKVIRWDKWLKHTEFKNSLLNIEDWYNRDDRFRKNFDSTVTEYFQRNANQANNNITFESSLLYLKEKCTAMTLWVQDEYDFELYHPSDRNLAMATTYETLIKRYSPNLLESVALRFKKSGKAHLV